jgi:MtfA peptidase
MFGLFRRWRRGKLFERELPDPWRELLSERFSFLDELADDELEHFHKHLKIFLWEKDWFGAHGLEVTDEMKLVIGGSAARLARNLPLDVYDRVREVGVYPSGFRPPDDEAFHAAGMAHDFGTVLFSWDNVKRGIATPNDGYDTTLHEFAHMLDLNSGQFSGTPLLHNADDYHCWAEILSEHFERLRDNPDRHDIIREYGATNEAEFFAVATEAFFEKPKTLKRRAPELYEQLRQYYRVDPLSRRPTIF